MAQQILELEHLIKTFILLSIISLLLHALWSRYALYRFALKFSNSFGLQLIRSYEVLHHIKGILYSIGSVFERSKSNNISIWLGLYATIVTRDPEFIEKVLTSKELLNKGDPLYKPVYEGFEGGLIGSPASVWRHNRKIINPCFRHKILISFFPQLHTAKNLLLSKFDKMANNGEHKLFAALLRLTIGISYGTTMGDILEPGEELSEDIVHDFKFITDKIYYHVLLSFVNMSPLYLLYFKYQTTKKRLLKMVWVKIEDKLKKINCPTKLQDNKTKGEEISLQKSSNIFIDQAIESYQKKLFSLKDVIAESNNMVAAASETTANSILSVLLMLAIHPAVQEHLYDEIVNVFPEKEFEVQFEHLEQLPYLDMVVSETLRLFPPVPLIARSAMKDTPLSKDLVLPKGINILISIFHTHRNKDIWGEHANDFNPYNFLQENLRRKPPGAYIPFSKGQRNCIGWRYALFAIKVILIGTVRNYRFTTSTKYEDIEVSYNIALKYVNEPSFKIYRRQ